MPLTPYDLKVCYANQENLDQIHELDLHIRKDLLLRAIMEKRVIIMTHKDEIIDILRFGFFWDTIPIINMFYFLTSYRNKGLGTKLHAFFEEDMRKKGHHKLMITTQKDETGQHFFRKLGYNDAGSFKYPDQADELIMFKDI